MSDEVLKAIAENKVKELETEVVKLEEELKVEEHRIQLAWEQWGSELAGDIYEGERKIEKKINAINKKIALLSRFVSNDLDISQESYLRTQGRELDKEIASLSDLKNSVNARIEEITIVKDLLAVTF